MAASDTLLGSKFEVESHVSYAEKAIMHCKRLWMDEVREKLLINNSTV